ncbi:hypothetical protein ACQ4LE_000117 [Meloidogyne hapla]
MPTSNNNITSTSPTLNIEHNQKQKQCFSNSHNNSGNNLTRTKSLDTCRVCGDGPARMHYGVPTCFGCKGFFRRTLKRTKEYTCRYSGNCIVDRYERNSCRFCRFKRCLEVGMDPKAVRPDRDAAGRTHPVRRRMSRNLLNGASNNEVVVGGEQEIIADNNVGAADAEWVRKLPVEMRTLLMQIMNIDVMITHGDTQESPQNLYPLPFTSLRQMFEDPTCLDGKRTEIRYEHYRQVEPEELTYLAHRRLIAAVDTIDHLCSLMDLHNIRDKLILTKAAYAPLSLFCSVSSTARITNNRDILCLCNYGYVPRGAHLTYSEPYHFANRIVDRALDELVEPFRTFNFKEREIVLMKAIVALNPYLPSLSTEAAEQIADFRDRLQETLYNVVRESHPKEVASSRFGNLLLFLPNIMILGSIMIENLQFIHSFGSHCGGIGPLLGELLEEDIDENIQDCGGVDDLLSLSSGENNDGSMCHSQSTGSINSQFTNTSTQSCEDITMLQHFQQHQQYSAPNLIGSSSIPKEINNKPNDRLTALPSVDSDPDYNTTLTAESLKQQGIQQQQMEIDDSPPQFTQSQQQLHQQNSMMSSLNTSQQQQQQQRPQFFIDPTLNQQQQFQQYQQQQQQITTVASTKHVFTIEKSSPTTTLLLQQPLQCSRERCAATIGNRCSNDECPAALAAIFQQQQQMQQAINNNNNNNNNIEANYNNINNNNSSFQPQSTINRSQSFSYFDAFDTNQQPFDDLITPPTTTYIGNYPPLPNANSYDNFFQHEQ